MDEQWNEKNEKNLAQVEVLFRHLLLGTEENMKASFSIAGV
jgi:hypothetical protein